MQIKERPHSTETEEEPPKNLRLYAYNIQNEEGITETVSDMKYVNLDECLRDGNNTPRATARET